MNTDGTGLLQLSPLGRSDSYPAWAPDGARIAFGTSGTFMLPRGISVLTLGTDASGALTVAGEESVMGETPFAAQLGWLDWARTSDRIAFSRYDDANTQWDLWVVDLADPQNPVRLTDTPDVYERMPSWSPDDTQIAFLRTGFGKESKRSGLYTMTATGGSLTSLSAKDGTQPSWRR